MLLAIIISAFVLRIANIENIPAGIYPDEAQNGIDAQQANTTGQYQFFYEANKGREGLFINLQALSIKYLGPTTLALKFPTIIFGTLTALGVFLLIYELFRNYTAGLIGAYLMTFSYWAINFSRLGFRAILVPFFLTFSFYFIFKGLRTKKISDFIVAGLLYGLGWHTYIAFRVSPLVLLALLAALIITRKQFLATYWKQIVVFTITALLITSPLIIDFFIFHPEHYTSRTSEISVFNPDSNQGNILLLISKNFWLSLQKYFINGDLNIRHNYPPYPLLNPLVGIAFLGGFICLLIKSFHLTLLRFKKGIRDEKLNLCIFLLVWFGALLIPEFLSNEGNPHALRSLGTLPVVMIIATIPFIWLIKKCCSFKRAYKIITITGLTIVFIFIGLADPLKYFIFFANNPQQHQAFAANLKEISNYIKTLPLDKEKYIVADSQQRLPIQYLNPDIPQIFYIYPTEALTIAPINLTNFEIVFTDPDWDIIKAQKNRFNNLNLEEHCNAFGDIFYVLKQ